MKEAVMSYKNHANKEIDVVIYGSTGYTGRLVAEHFSKNYTGTTTKWAMAGRSQDKLEQVRDEIGASADTTLIVADSANPDSLAKMCSRAKVVISTVGPYTLYGEALVKACVEAGTDYVDLCGESNFIREMVDKYDLKAKETGARIVCSCGFDSIPFDLGVLHVQKAAIDKFGEPCEEVRGRVTAMEGKFSGGTAYSIKASVGAAMKDPALLAQLGNPFALTPGFEGPAQPAGEKVIHEDDLNSWAAPFIMAAINTKNVHRTNALINHRYGSDFKYSEMILTGPGETGEATARAVASDKSIMGENAPKPGEGPTKDERENGHYAVLFLGETAKGDKITATVKGDKDPGYGSTSKMIGESAMCLIEDATDTVGGVFTPGAVMGDQLTERLQKKAGLTFSINAG